MVGDQDLTLALARAASFLAQHPTRAAHAIRRYPSLMSALRPPRRRGDVDEFGALVLAEAERELAALRPRTPKDEADDHRAELLRALAGHDARPRRHLQAVPA